MRTMIEFQDELHLDFSYFALSFFINTRKESCPWLLRAYGLGGFVSFQDWLSCFLPRLLKSIQSQKVVDHYVRIEYSPHNTKFGQRNGRSSVVFFVAKKNKKRKRESFLSFPALVTCDCIDVSKKLPLLSKFFSHTLNGVSNTEKEHAFVTSKI